VFFQTGELSTQQRRVAESSALDDCPFDDSPFQMAPKSLDQVQALPDGVTFPPELKVMEVPRQICLIRQRRRRPRLVETDSAR
jgi:hypothetical protein